ncbi:MAG: DEAD/DEAH box helicase family protein [Patescibacteria group bacterium]
MTLKDLNLKGYYDFNRDNLLEDFYIPVLSESISYKRIAGYFSSSALAIAARGIKNFINNGGEIQLIACVELTEKDQEAIKKAIEEKEKQIIKELESMEDALKKGCISLLGWMIKNDKLEIKIAVVPQGLEHKKKGILEDEEGNIVSFSGSDNETVSGWIHNDEGFHVFCNWIEGDKERHLEEDIKSFQDLWGESGEIKTKVYPVSEAFKKGLIKTAPRDKKELVRLCEEVTKRLLEESREKRVEELNLKKEEIELREYQKEAIKNWFDNDCKGIFEMATGTGKTFTALGALKKLLKKEKGVLIIISCPYQHLVTQWRENIQEFDFNLETFIANSTNSKWKSQLTNNLYDLRNKIIDNLIILTTHDTLSSKFFYEQIEKNEQKSILIVDEVHGIGSEVRKNGLIENYNFRLGLSATPDRWFDEDGTKTIRDFFGKTVYEFPLKKAIDEGFLTKYDYKPIFVELNDSEIEEYEKQTAKIARFLTFSKNEIEKEKLLNLLFIKRQKIIINAQNKFVSFEELISELKNIRYCLVYVSPEQIDEVQYILNNKNIVQHRFTNREGVIPKKTFRGLSERDFLLKNFEEGTYDILVAMRCLDEGVDVPPARTAIILASSGNPKEYIQRRGRILRKHPEKNRAVIYDLIVVPPVDKIKDKDLIELERKILKKEIIRYKEFCDSANNKLECLNKIYKVCKRYNL